MILSFETGLLKCKATFDSNYSLAEKVSKLTTQDIIKAVKAHKEGEKCDYKDGGQYLSSKSSQSYSLTGWEDDVLLNTKSYWFCQLIYISKYILYSQIAASAKAPPYTHLPAA